MATISRHGKGWRVQIRRRGHPALSETFPLRKQAEAWAAQRESEIVNGKLGILPKHTLLEALQKYATDVAPTHKGARWEIVRLKKLGRHRIAQKQISAIAPGDIAAWRDESLLAISGASVRREMGLLGQVFDKARREWRWVSVDPMKDVDRPSGRRSGTPKPVTHEAIWGMVKALGAAHKSRETALAFLIGIETAMRPTEIFSLEPAQIDFAADVAHLEQTKNGDSRDVPLSMLAHMWLLELLWMNGDKLFTVSSDSASALWAKARKETPYTLHFRHSRREGIWRLSKRLDILELARAAGHRNLSSLLIYYNTSAADMAKKL